MTKQQRPQVKGVQFIKSVTLNGKPEVYFQDGVHKATAVYLGGVIEMTETATGETILIPIANCSFIRLQKVEPSI